MTILLALCMIGLIWALSGRREKCPTCGRKVHVIKTGEFWCPHCNRFLM